MGLRRKVLAAATVLTFCAIAVSGSFAWSDLNMHVLNVWWGAADNCPGGTLHDDHEDSDPNKDVYVENWGDEDIFVRIRLSEYMETGAGAGLKSVSIDPDKGIPVHNPQNQSEPLVSGSDIDNLSTWAIFTPNDNNPAESADDKGFHTYWQWNMGGRKYYYPAPEDGRENKEYVDSGSPEGLSAGSVNESGVMAKQTLPARVLTMAQWKLGGTRAGNYWVIDTDGWAYWASPLRGGEATGLLTDSVTLIEPPGKDYYYAINVAAQMATKNGSKSNGYRDSYERFGDMDRGGWTDDGRALLEKLVNSAEAPADDPPDDAEIYAELTAADQPQILVKYKSAGSADSFNRLSAAGAEGQQPDFSIEEVSGELGICAVKVSNEEDIGAVLSLLEQDGSIESVQPNYPVEYAQMPIDPYFRLQWPLENTGQDVNGSKGVAGVDISVVPVWNSGHSLNEVIVAVIDGGINVSHPDLAGKTLPGYNIYRKGTSSEHIVFDDDDGYHGTAVTSLIAAVWNNIGIAGIAPNAKIIPVKVLLPLESNAGTSAGCIAGIEFAAEHGAEIINCSWVFDKSDSMLSAVIRKYDNILFVCSAGNDGNQSARYPASYEFDNVIGVSAIENTGVMAKWSSFGRAIDIAAPGDNIYAAMVSKENMNTYGYFNGTSAAAPIV